MKDYNEMANAVFRRRDEFVAARKKRNAVLLKAGASVCALLLVAVVGISVWRNLPQIPSVKPTEPTASASAEATQSTQKPQTNENETTQNVSDKTQDKTEVKVDSTKTDNTESFSGKLDPTEEKTTGDSGINDKPQTGDPSLPPDPTEKPTDNDSQFPGADFADPTSPGYPPDTMSPTVVPDEPTTAAEETLPTECTEPTVGDWTIPDVEPTMPATGPLYIKCDGKTYEAQTGDMVTLNVELKADELIQSANINVKYGYGKLEVVNLKDLGFSLKQRRLAHMPNVGNISSTISYKEGNSGGYNGVGVSFAASNDDEVPDFTEKKLLFTFSFIVKKPGSIEFEIVPNYINSINGTKYFEYGKQMVSKGVNLGANLKITPKSQVKLPVPPVSKKPEPVEETPFTYPKESSGGDLVINCDGRTYSANVGNTVNFVAEMKADALFENIHLVLDYPEEYLRLNIPEKGKQAFPNLYGMVFNFLGYKDFTTNEIINPAVIMVAQDICGFDFTKRQVLVNLEFEVIKAGEINLDLHFEDMVKCEDAGEEGAYFDTGVQKSFDDIYIYEYVLVK